MTTRAPFPHGLPQEPGGAAGGPGAGTGSEGGHRSRRNRPRSRTLLPPAVALWAVLEIWLLTLLGQAAGGFTVFLVLAGGFVLGAVVIKRAGRRAWRNLAETVQRAQEQARTGAEPSREDAAESRGGNGTTMLGGLLLMIPGLLSDAAGLLLILPPTGRLLRGAVQRSLDRRSGFAPGTLGDAYQQARTAEQQVRMHRPDGKVVQGEVVRDDEPQGREGGQGGG
ncbi:FxsA family membrane protein [Streptomyces sp. NPDC007083]|uniref:FxsA family membrane protein n=1 Tax=unclassified Streptomyces TaxID=2593676 RepID=UPI0033D18250